MDVFRKLKDLDILLVDGDYWIRDSLSIYFESEDCSLVTLETAEKALMALNRRKFDIIITDYKLPGMDGIAFLKKIKSSHPKAVKLMITAYASDAIIRQAKHAGAQQLIPKPFTSETIVACLAQLIDNDYSDAGQGNG